MLDTCSMAYFKLEFRESEMPTCECFCIFCEIQLPLPLNMISPDGKSDPFMYECDSSIIHAMATYSSCDMLYLRSASTNNLDR